MKSKLIAVALFTGTVASVAFYPAYKSLGAVTNSPIAAVIPTHSFVSINNTRPVVEVVFVLDATGSMSGLIQAAKEKIWSIATTMASAQPAPLIKVGLVAFRDRGDEYVTKMIDLSSDLDSVYASLMDIRADGGGDGPESVNQALADAVNKMSWSTDQKAYKAVFLVGDAAPHMDYQDDVKYPVTLSVARAKGITVNTIQCGQDAETLREWHQIATLAGGDYFQVDQAGSAVAMTTPFDEKLARLSEKLDGTRLYYGNKEDKEKQALKVAASDKVHAEASVESRARRATFNASASGATNLLGDNELVDDVTSGRVELGKINQAQLPATLQAMALSEQQAKIAETARQRDELKKAIGAIADQRTDYLKREVAKAGGAKDSLDAKLFSTVRAQAEKKGLHYEADAPQY